MVKLNEHLLFHTTIAALLVIFGVIVKNSFEQLNKNNHPWGKLISGQHLGKILFISGWLYTAFILSKNKKNSHILSLSSLAILIVVMIMKYLMNNNKNVPFYLPLIFAFSWLILGYNVGSHFNGLLKYSGLISSILVILSMMVTLPFQRMFNIVDGPGMPLFIFAWVIIIFINSMR
jgi:membrane-associated HD superfamily phosphohydrolase